MIETIDGVVVNAKTARAVAPQQTSAVHAEYLAAREAYDLDPEAHAQRYEAAKTALKTERDAEAERARVLAAVREEQVAERAELVTKAATVQASAAVHGPAMLALVLSLAGHICALEGIDAEIRQIADAHRNLTRAIGDHPAAFAARGIGPLQSVASATRIELIQRIHREVTRQTGDERLAYNLGHWVEGPFNLPNGVA